MSEFKVTGFDPSRAEYERVRAGARAISEELGCRGAVVIVIRDSERAGVPTIDIGAAAAGEIPSRELAHWFRAAAKSLASQAHKAGRAAPKVKP